MRTLISVFFIIRNNYTYNITINCNFLISKYCNNLIQKNEYDSGINYYKEFKMPYTKHLFNITLWDEYSVIKPEYKEILKPFMK